MNTKETYNELRHDEKVSFKDLYVKLNECYNFLLSKYIKILLWGIIGGALGLGVSIYTKPVFNATTTFVLEDNKSGGGMLSQYAGIASMVGVDLGGSGGGIFQGDNIIELYKSRAMIQKALLTNSMHKGKEELLIDTYIRMNDLRNKWRDNPNLRNIHFNPGTNQSRLQDSVLGDVIDKINKEVLSIGKPDKKLNIINVTVRAKDEYFASAFNSQIVNTVSNFYILTKTKKTLQNVSILQHQTDSVRSVLKGAINSAIEVADATPNLNPSRQILRAPAQHSQFNAEANKAILTELVKNLELAKISLRQETPLIQIVDSPIYPLKVDRIGKLKGGVIGFLLGGMLSAMFLLLAKFFRGLLN
ncbi:lipopolysaccharide biosynthesis protein [Mucilaginibacter jinjuensis]|uniref:Lipopolysaccharide biosynthesis protein n=1 Tax=Mucilaginibacter jinjuensis TaxID=1176721 RepID=A0ABY7TAQ1_9SPHI|nr:lipopolysaccharide biosynthesis protein [Mucilaginibacter jinjuensis]WCT13165.1 lipopolysaccharide biosynthesis protein [Mucilaginibacter jinjuensis]